VCTGTPYLSASLEIVRAHLRRFPRACLEIVPAEERTIFVFTRKFCVHRNAHFCVSEKCAYRGTSLFVRHSKLRLNIDAVFCVRHCKFCVQRDVPFCVRPWKFVIRGRPLRVRPWKVCVHRNIKFCVSSEIVCAQGGPFRVRP
jgi:hypothetical protein